MEATEEALVQQLQKIRKEKEDREAQERQEESDKVFQRCLGHQYLKHTNELKDCFIYRKVSNLRKYSQRSTDDCNICDLHEQIYLCIRPNIEDKSSIFGTGQKITCEIQTFKTKQSNNQKNFVQYDIPCSEEEYLNVRNYVIQMSKNFLEFKELTNKIFDKKVGL